MSGSAPGAMISARASVTELGGAKSGKPCSERKTTKVTKICSQIFKHISMFMFPMLKKKKTGPGPPNYVKNKHFQAQLANQNENTFVAFLVLGSPK